MARHIQLRDCYPRGTRIHRARILREMDGTEIGATDVIRYATGTEVYVVLDDPERPGMADVQLPNGKLVRTMQRDVELIRLVDPA